MKYTENLSWILDDPGSGLSLSEKIRKNVEFVHSLGLKCDCVGWSDLDLASPDTPEVLRKISEFCKESGLSARGIYTREYAAVESNWYELVPSPFKSNTPCGRIETVTEHGEKVYTQMLRAYCEVTAAPKNFGNEIYVPDRFRQFCISSHIEDLDFCWAKDKGKYEAEQYFHVYGRRLIPRVAVDFDLKQSNRRGILAAGGWLPEIDRVFQTLQWINLQDCYLASDLPDKGIAYAYIPRTPSSPSRHNILIHKEIAQALLQERIFPASALRPAAVVQELPGGYTLKSTQPLLRPTHRFMAGMLAEYEKQKSANRPMRIASEKEALKALRLSKRERKEDFQKAMSKADAQNLLDTVYSPAIPYYSVADGGILSPEYEFLSFSMSMVENHEFQQNLAAEELLDSKPIGIVIGRCPDGDVILLCRSGEVVRFSHEAPEIVEQWPTLAQFFIDAIYN